MIRRLKISLLTAVLMAVCVMQPSDCQASTTREPQGDVVFSLYFRLDDDLLLKSYKSNDKELAAMEQWMTPENIARIASISIVGSASPEGSMERNSLLSQRRAKAVRGYILWRWGCISQQKLHLVEQPDLLTGWMLAVQEDPDIPNRESVLKILNSNATVRTKWANIRLQQPEAALYMTHNTFPLLRSAVACVITLKEPVADSIIVKGDSVAIEKGVIPVHDSIAAPPVIVEEAIAEVVPEIIPEIVPEIETHIEPTASYRYVRPVAFKTNLLFDLATALNFEVEVPVASKWSVMAEWTFPWWLLDNKQYCLQLLSGSVEGRYWFNPNRTKQEGSLGRHNPLTGWFAGVYAGAGLYDLEWGKEGYQGEFWHAGLTAGYVLPLSRSFSMEFSLGFGYLNTKWRHYTPQQDVMGDWHLVHQSNGRTIPALIKPIGIVPTKAKISFIWYPHIKKRK